MGTYKNSTMRLSRDLKILVSHLATSSYNKLGHFDSWFYLDKSVKVSSCSFRSITIHRSMPREYYESSDEDDMDSQYPTDGECLMVTRHGECLITRPYRDMHNRCCAGKAWCIKVRLSICYFIICIT